MTRWLLTLAVLLCPAGLLARDLAQDTDGDGIPDVIEGQLGTFIDRAERFTTVLTDPDEPTAGGPGQALDFVAVDLAHVAENRWLWRIQCVGEAEPRGGHVIVYLDADNDLTTGRIDKPEVVGTDIMYTFQGWRGSEALHNPRVAGSRAGTARYAWHNNNLYICDDIALAGDDAVARFRVRLLSQRPGTSDSCDFHDGVVPRDGVGAKPPIVAPSGLAFRGLPREAVEPVDPRPEFPRPRPAPPFAATPRSGRPAPASGPAAVEVSVLEEHGRDRLAVPVTFGFPLAGGRPEQVAVELDGQPLPADITATCYRPEADGQELLRWVLIDTAMPMAAGAERQLKVTLDPARVNRPDDLVKVEVGGDQVTLSSDTTRLVVGLDPVRILSLQAAAGGPAVRGRLTLLDTAGTALEPAAGAVVVEYDGPRRAVVRVTAPYRDAAGREFFRAVLRFTIAAGRPGVELAHTLVNDHLDWEFSDFQSLHLDLEHDTASAGGTLLGLADGPVAVSPNQGLEVASERRCTVAGQERETRPDGVLVTRAAGGGGLAVGVLDFWQRYPKALWATAQGQRIGLFPAQVGGCTPEPDLPRYLSFPFVEGQYRFKWGMATTDRLVLAPFAAAGEPAAVDAALNLNQSVVPVTPAAWYAETGSLGQMVAPDGDLFVAWDEMFESSFDAHLATKERQREYGFFNWGDWYGERGTNWGNNEYDLPHGLLMQFARTGDRRYYRLATAGARHQADVDMVHAYPDPFYLGGNILHSFAHTGEWSQHVSERSWSFPYGFHATAANGHTWSSGMVRTWWLAGDPVVMDATLGLGEHIAWQMSPVFNALGTHERSAGWQVHAAAQIYQATGDPALMEAIRRVCAVAYREQDLAETGAWPHVLPGDHAGGVPNLVGNVSFLIGVLLAGIDHDWTLTGNPRAAEAIVRGTGWLATQWKDDLEVFAYTSSPTFHAAASRQSPGLNALVLQPLIRAGLISNDARLLEIGRRGFANLCRYGDSGFGKSLSQYAHFAPDIMAQLVAAGPGPGDAALRLTRRELQQEDLRRAGPPRHLALRGPVEKRLRFRHDGGALEVTASRETWGAMSRNAPTGFVRLLGPDGQTLADQEFSTDTFPVEFRHRLPAGAPAGDYALLINDDLRGRWHVAGPPRLMIDQSDGPIQFGGLGQARLFFPVPAGTDRFTVTVRSHHEGAAVGYIYGPDGELVGELGPVGRQTVSLTVTVKPEQAGHPWSLISRARMDSSIVLEGVPPYLATSAEALFEPRR